MKDTTHQMILDAISAVATAESCVVSPTLRQSILDRLNDMLNTELTSREIRDKISFSIVRAMMEDYVFFQSPLGQKLVEVSNAFKECA